MERTYIWALYDVSGMRALPPGQFSFNKDEVYQQELDEEYQILVNNESYEIHGAPYWVSEVQREITNSGESPLFTNNLLSSGKFEQEQGVINFERALLHSNTRRSVIPRRRHLNDRKEYYRPNSTHQYLSATDLRNLHENEENMIKYGRPTRTTLLRARHRTSSAPVNAYDIRRENNKRTEEVRHNASLHPLKDYLNVYASEGESVHSFLTGARYNRAHLVDSKGLSVYGVYMPRGHPSDCFITGPRRLKEVGDDIPSAPPDSPRSDAGDTPSPLNISRPSSSKNVPEKPSSRSSSGKLSTKNSTSRPHSWKKQISRISSSQSRPRSAKDKSVTANNTHALPPKSPPKSPDKKELPLPDEVTMAMPDHINKGKHGVYVTLKGQKIIESVDSKLPRVTGVSLPKIRKSRDFVDEMHFVNQPPPTPVDVSAVSVDKNRFDMSNEGRSIHQIEEQAIEEETITDRTKQNLIETEVKDEVEKNPKEEHKNDDRLNIEVVEKKKSTISKVTERENVITEKKSLEIGLVKKVNFDDVNINTTEEENTRSESKEYKEHTENRDENISEKVKKNTDNVIFFITEDNESGDKTARSEKSESNEVHDVKDTDKDTKVDETLSVNIDDELNGNDNSDNGEQTIDDVIKIEISENEKKTEETNAEEVNSDGEKPVTSSDYPFDDQSSS